MIEMIIDSIRVSLINYQRVVILKERAAERYLPIWIGPAEADAIAVKLQGATVPRPLSHDLLHSVIGALVHIPEQTGHHSGRNRPPYRSKSATPAG